MPSPPRLSPLVGAPLAPTMLRLAIPGVIGALLQSSMMLIEARFLGHISTGALAAAAVVFPLIMLNNMLSGGAVGGAVSGSVARALGAGDMNRASAVLMSALVLSVALGVGIGVLVLVFGASYFAWAGATAHVLDAATTYAAIIFAALPLLWLFNMTCAVLRGSGDMVRAALAMASLVLAYVLLGSSLIPKESTSLTDTMQWAAIAMMLSYAVATLVAFAFLLRPAQPIRLLRANARVGVLWAVLKQGLMAGSQSLMTVVYALVTTALLSRHGLEWLAGYGLGVRLELLMVPVIFGIGSSMIAIVGAYAGAGLRDRAIAIAWRGSLINAVIVGVIGIVLALFPALWCAPLASNGEVAGHCAQTVRTIGPWYGFFALGLGMYFASQGLNTLLWPVLGALLRLVIVIGLFVMTDDSLLPQQALAVIAVAVTAYGVFVVTSLRLGPWRPATS